MADPRFFKNSGALTLSQLAEIAGAKIGGSGDSAQHFSDVSSLEEAGPSDVSFIDNRKYVEAFERTKAGAIITAEDLVDRAPASATLLVTPTPYRGYAKVAQAFYPPPEPPEDLNPSATIDAAAKIGEGVSIDAGAVLLAESSLGDRSSIGANTVVGQGVVIGNDCRIGPNVTLTHCLIGDRVIIHPGVRIGQDGFGFAPGATGHEKVPQLGRVLIGDDVEIGANTTIDRGAGPDTIIGSGTKIDNLVQIGHNVELGSGCFIVAQAGIAGSTKIGDYAMVGGQAGIVGHLVIGNGAKIAAQSGVSHDVAAGKTAAGSPATDAREHWKQMATLRRLTKGKGT